MRCLIQCFVALLIATSGAFFSTAETKPNVILIVADDMGYGDGGVYNADSKIKTPHIDRLAAQGMRFTDAHSASGTCTPSRYGLLTGTNPARTGVKNTLLHRGIPVIDADEATIATLLKDQGYATYMVGKWHLGFDMKSAKPKPVFDFDNPITGGPCDHGFDTFFGLHSSPGAQPYFYLRDRRPVAKPSKRTEGISKDRDKRKTWAPGAIAAGYDHFAIYDTLCDEAVSMIKDHADQKRNQPMFLYYALAAPHAPWLPKKEFQGSSSAGSYGDFVQQLDAEVGRIVTALEESGMREDTLLIFTSDNGPKWDPPDVAKWSGHKAAGPLRGGKAEPYEGGHRVPFVASWPKRIKPGTTSSATINFTDFFATIAELLNVDYTRNYPTARDSHSFASVLNSPTTRHDRPPMVNTLDCIRIGDWKLVARKRKSGPTAKGPADFELFNLKNDLAESTDVRNNHPEVAQRLFTEYKRFLADRQLKAGAK
jgi:arylsulfatase A-like enzyme